MAIFTKDNPVGRDAAIDRLQTFLYNSLSLTDHDSFHRAYKNIKSKDDTSLVPQHYSGTGEYKPLYYSDKVNVTSFFLAADEVNQNEDRAYNTDVSIIYEVNLDKVFPLITTKRPDEEFINNVLYYINKNAFGFEFNNYVTGVENVYAGLNTDLPKLTNIGKRFVVRFNLRIDSINYECLVGGTSTSPVCAPGTVTDTNGIDTFEVDSGGFGACTPGVSPSGILYNPPPYSQTTSYVANDAGDNAANGVYDYLTRPANPAVIAAIDYSIGFTILKSNNAFGNKNRFTDINGLQLYNDGDTYIIDHFTGLAWSFKSKGQLTWTAAITAATASVLNGFSDWRLPTISEFDTIVNNEELNPLQWSPFINTIGIGAFYWSNNTRKDGTTEVPVIAPATALGGTYFAQSIVAKSSTRFIVYIRNHYT